MLYAEVEIYFTTIIYRNNVNQHRLRVIVVPSRRKIKSQHILCKHMLYFISLKLVRGVILYFTVCIDYYI